MIRILTLCCFCIITITCIAQRGVRPDTEIGASAGTVRALIVGITHYKNIPKADYAADDALLFKNYLLENKKNRIKKEHISLLIDTMATRGHIFRELKKLADLSKQGDMVWFYFAGHGDVEADIDAGFLLAWNCEKTNYPATDAIGLEYLEKYCDAMTAKGVQVRVVTDACRSGKLAGGESGIENTMTALTARFKRTVKLLSCQPGEVSVSRFYNEGGHGTFTYHLVKGLRGLADQNSDGVVTLDELQDYVKHRVVDETGKMQHPKLEGNPELVMSYVDQVIKASMVSGNLGVPVYEGPDPQFADKLKPASRLLYDKFREAVNTHSLIRPEGKCAYAFYLYAKDTLRDKKLSAQMKEELVAELQDDAQKLINKYLNGEVFKATTKEKRYYYAIAAEEEQLALSLMDTKNPTYNMCRAKAIFLSEYETILFGTNTPPEEHIRLINTADSLLPNSAYIKTLLGMCYRKTDTTKAMSYYREAIKLAPTWATPYNSIGKMYVFSKQYEKAMSYFQKAIDKDSAYANVYYNIAWSYARQGTVDEALIWFEKFLQHGFVDWDYMRTDNELGVLLNDPRYIALLEKYRR